MKALSLSSGPMFLSHIIAYLDEPAGSEYSKVQRKCVGAESCTIIILKEVSGDISLVLSGKNCTKYVNLWWANQLALLFSLWHVKCHIAMFAPPLDEMF